MRLIDRADREWADSGSPDNAALFMGEYVGFSRQCFFLPPSASEYFPNLIVKYDAYLIEEPEPHRLQHKIAGSDAAFSIWCPWMNVDSIEFPPLRSGTFRNLAQSDDVSEEDLPEPNDVADVSEDERDLAMSFMKSGRYADALPILVRSALSNPKDYGNWYMAGQCYRFTDNLPKAIEFLKEASRLNPIEPAVFLALGIAAMTRRLVRTFNNASGRGITKFHDSPYSLWGEYALFGAMFIASSDSSVTDMAMPTGEFAMREEKDEGYEGLYWQDQIGDSGKKTRLFLPNYFNTFEARLHDNIDYSLLIKGKGTALQELGRESEAWEHYDEAEYFRPIQRQ